MDGTWLFEYSLKSTKRRLVHLVSGLYSSEFLNVFVKMKHVFSERKCHFIQSTQFFLGSVCSRVPKFYRKLIQNNGFQRRFAAIIEAVLLGQHSAQCFLRYLQAYVFNLQLSVPRLRLWTGQSWDGNIIFPNYCGDVEDEEGRERHNGQLPLVLIRLYEDC